MLPEETNEPNGRSGMLCGQGPAKIKIFSELIIKTGGLAWKRKEPKGIAFATEEIVRWDLKRTQATRERPLLFFSFCKSISLLGLTNQKPQRCRIRSLFKCIYSIGACVCTIAQTGQCRAGAKEKKYRLPALFVYL